MKNAVLYVVTFLALQLVIANGVVLVADLIMGEQSTGSTAALLNLAGVALSSVVTAVLFLWQKWAVATRDYIVSRPYAVLCWAVLASLGTIVPSMAAQELMPEMPVAVQQIIEEMEEQMMMLMGERGGYFVVCLLVPVVEELVFRGAVLRALLQWSPRSWLMIVCSALFFALVHGNPAQMPHAFVIGILLGWLYWRTDSIVPGVVFHWANNTAAFLLARAYPDPQLQLSDVLGSGTSVGAAVLFSLFILLPSLYQLHLRMRREG